MADFSKVRAERDIFTDAWFIVKEHIGIERRPADDPEWIRLTAQCQALYEKGGNQAQRKLATATASALMDYYTELCKMQG